MACSSSVWPDQPCSVVCCARISLIALSEGAPLAPRNTAGARQSPLAATTRRPRERLFGGGSGRFAQPLLHQLAEMRDQGRHVGRQPVEPRLLPEPALVHVERPVDL